jgi:thiamine-monophosphate kinase
MPTDASLPANLATHAQQSALRVLPPAKGSHPQLALSVDTLVEGIHFFAQVSANALGHKCAAVNLSDIAAMGAQPAWLVMYVQQAKQDLDWLADFTAGAQALAASYDTKLSVQPSSGPQLRITVQVGGHLVAGQATTRSGASAGDDIIVTGTLGDAGAALALHYAEQFDHANPDHKLLNERLERPTPRIHAGLLACGLASSGLDLSDGLVGDIAHLLGDDLGACIDAERLPLSPTLRKVYPRQADAMRLALSGGDDYELCLTVPRAKRDELIRKCTAAHIQATQIGSITANGLVEWRGIDLKNDTLRGYQHFRT